ncbi:MAG: BglG family transcription antiterminator [Mycoplasmatales bacterium]
MISERMLKVIKFIETEKQTSIKQTASEIQETEQAVRYDIKRINQILAFHKYSEIKRGSKGTLEFPSDITSTVICELSTNYFIQSERMFIIQAILLCNSSYLKLNKIAGDLAVSRSTIKNDLYELEQTMVVWGIKVHYHTSFTLVGEQAKIDALFIEVFKKIIVIIKKAENEQLKHFELVLYQQITSCYHGYDLFKVIAWVTKYLKQSTHVFTDDAFTWSAANVLLVLSRRLQVASSTQSNKNELVVIEEIQNLETMLELKFGPAEIIKLEQLIKEMGLTTGLKKTQTKILTQVIVANLIDIMEQQLEFSFAQDQRLVEGLTQHLVPIFEREHALPSENLTSLLATEDRFILQIVDKACQTISELATRVNELDILHISIYFLTSIRRQNKALIKKVLLICGFGYGTTAMLRETLEENFYLQIVDVVSKYFLSEYMTTNADAKTIDLIISTTKVDYHNMIPAIEIHPFPSAADLQALEQIGLHRKTLSANLEAEKIVKMNLVQPRQFSSLINLKTIKLTQSVNCWQDAVKQASQLLTSQGIDGVAYGEQIIDAMEELGFYAVTDQMFAMLHSDPIEGIEPQMSLLIVKEPVDFGNKRVKIIFCLACGQPKEHVYAMTKLIRLVKQTDLLQKLEQVESAKAAFKLINEYEKESNG